MLMYKCKRINKINYYIIAIIFILSIMITKTIYASEQPKQDCHGVDHPSITYSNAFTHNTFRISALDSISYTKDIYNALSSMGYYNSYYYSNSSAKQIQTAIGSDAVFYVGAHGGPGKVILPRYNSGTWKVEYLTADSTSDSMAYSLEHKYKNTTNKLKKVRFAYFGSCHSALTSRYGYGNLLATTVSLGADCALGFEDSIYDTKEGYFSKRLFSGYLADPNNSVSASAASAKRDTYRKYGNYGGVNTYTICGKGNIKLTPAAYGTY